MVPTARAHADDGVVSPAALLAPVRASLTVAVVLQTFASVAGVLPLVALTQLAAAVVNSESTEMTTWIVVGVVGAVVRAVLLPCAFAVSHRADADLQDSLRTRIVGHISRLPLGFFDHRSSAQIKRAVADDVGALHHLVGHAVLDLVSLVVTPLAVLVTLALLAPALVPLVLLPPVIGFGLNQWSSRRIAGTMPKYHESTAELESATTEIVRAIAPIRLYSGEGRVFGRFSRACDDYSSFVHSWARGLTGPMTATQIAFAPLTVLLVVAIGGGVLVALGSADLVAVGSAVLLGPAVGASFLPLAFAFQDVAQGRAAMHRIAELLSMPVVRQDPVLPAVQPGDRVIVELQDVAVEYGDHVAVESARLTLVPGRVVALVGRSGSGKSTVARVVAGLQPPSAGRALLDGCSYADLGERDIVTRVAWVATDARTLRASVHDNIALATPGASRDSVIAAARRAQIHDRIRGLADGYDTVLGEGVELSGGEAQRVCLARALLAGRPVLVLDEATSALDELTQRRVLDELRNDPTPRATLVVAHRLETVRDADEIVVLDAGRVVERGRHGQLLAASGHYSRLWAEQQGASAC